MLQRNLLYTAVTRGRRLVVLVGQRKALAIAGVRPARAPALDDAPAVADGVITDDQPRSTKDTKKMPVTLRGATTRSRAAGRGAGAPQGGVRRPQASESGGSLFAGAAPGLARPRSGRQPEDRKQGALDL